MGHKNKFNEAILVNTVQDKKTGHYRETSIRVILDNRLDNPDAFRNRVIKKLNGENIEW